MTTYVNNEYVLGTQGLEPEHYFQRTDVSEKAGKQLSDIPDRIEQLLNALDADQKPEVDPWMHCHVPYICVSSSHRIGTSGIVVRESAYRR